MDAGDLPVGALHALVARHAHASPVLLLDVREPWEVALAPIEVAGGQRLNLPLGSLAQNLDALDRLQPVVCICHHGVRSRQAVAILRRAGFEAVYNLAGGTEAWSMEVDPAVARY